VSNKQTALGSNINITTGTIGAGNITGRTGTTITAPIITASGSLLYGTTNVATKITELETTKQNTLDADDNITTGTISSGDITGRIGTTITAPIITASGSLLYGDTNVATKIGSIEATLLGKQSTLTAGNNITITNNTISSTDGITQTQLDEKQDKLATTSYLNINSLNVSNNSFSIGTVVPGQISCDSLVIADNTLDNIISTISNGIIINDLEALETAIGNEIIRATNAELSIIESLSTTTYNSGEIIKTKVIYKSSFSIFNNNISTKNSWQLHSKCSYIANGSNILYVTYNLSEYNYAGTGDDASYARMHITYNGATTYSYRTRQNYRAGTGGGTRSGTIIPLSFNYNITGTAKTPTVTIGVDVYLGGDDNWTCDSDNNGAHFHILEYVA
jgi:hypothetical protein